ncbi:hypothetical protein ACIBU0_33595 [Streptomyces sp. NPDC049627]|uniref:hypothetical protein n=1 Tax=Streptomyces sp. NPDC049627 TaxID=3365595 RepID=UPI0037A8E20B
MSQHHLADRSATPASPQPYGSYPASPASPNPSSPMPPQRTRHRTEPTPSPTAGGRRGGRRRAPKRTPLLGNYLGYAATFVGAGLISGAIVHHPLDPARYTLIAVIGAAVFLFATLLNEFVLKRERPGATKVAGIVVASLALSFGIGMLSGGLQHFEDFPERAAMLIPFGLTLSFIAYVLRHEPARWRSIVGPAGVLVVITAALAFVGLRGIAEGMAAESEGDGHSHSHGEESAEETGVPKAEPEEGEPTQDHEPEGREPSTRPSQSDTAAEEAEEAGHTEDGHSH